jgi:hypothetical protein
MLHVCVTVLSAGGSVQPGAAVLEATSQAHPLGETGSDGVVCVDVARGKLLIARSGSQVSRPAPALDSVLKLQLMLQVIGTVPARKSFDLGSTIGDMDPAALVSNGAGQALRLTPRYRSQAEGGSGAIEVNGIPLPPPSNGIATSGFTNDLFASVTPTESATSDIPNFHLVSPTADPKETLEVGAASYGGTLYRGTASGRHGYLGYGLSLVGGGDNGALYGMVERDLSGQVYDHSTHAHHIGTTVNLSYNLKTTTFGFSAVTETRNAADIATAAPGLELNGFGPGTALPSHENASWITIDHAAGRDEFSYIGVRYFGGGSIDHTHATSLGAPAPFSVDYNFSGVYQQFKAKRSYADGSLSFVVAAQHFTGGSVGGVGAPLQSLSTESHARLAYQREGTHVSFGTELGISHAAGTLGATAPDATANVTYQNHGSSARFAYSDVLSQTAQSFSAETTQLSPAATALFICSGGSAIVSAPSIVGTEHPRSQTLSLDLRSSTKYGDITGGAYTQVVRNGLVSDADYTLTSLTPGYLARLRRFYQGSCGGATLDPTQIFGQGLVQVPALVSKEAYIADHKTLGPWALDGFYEVLARYTPQGIGVVSTIVPYAQLASVPAHRANLLVSYTNKHLLAAADAYYVSANNGANLPGHIELMLGSAVMLPRGTLSLSVQNPLSSFEGSVISSRYAIPLMTTAKPLATLATPVAQTWTLRYAFAVRPRPELPQNR